MYQSCHLRRIFDFPESQRSCKQFLTLVISMAVFEGEFLTCPINHPQDDPEMPVILTALHTGNFLKVQRGSTTTGVECSQPGQGLSPKGTEKVRVGIDFPRFPGLMVQRGILALREHMLGAYPQSLAKQLIIKSAPKVQDINWAILEMKGNALARGPLSQATSLKTAYSLQSAGALNIRFFFFTEKQAQSHKHLHFPERSHTLH